MCDKESRNYSLDLLKIIATVLLVFHHWQQVEKVTFPHVNFFGGRFYFGYIVELFFILSGFFMYRYISRIREGLTFKNFFLKRYLRFFPLMAISAVTYEIVCIYYLRISGGADGDPLVTLWGTIIAALGIHSGWVFTAPNPAINNPTWYISVLLLCYIVFYYVTYLTNRVNLSPWYCYIFLIFLGIGIRTFNISLPFIMPKTGRGYTCFFWGVILAKLFVDRKRPISKTLYLFCIFITISIPLLIVFAPNFISYGLDCTLTFLFYPALIILFSSPVFGKMFSFQWIGTLSRISFNVFIWHICGLCILDILRVQNIINGQLTSPLAMIIFTACMFIVGTASHYLIEKPIDKMVQSRLTQIPGQTR